MKKKRFSKTLNLGILVKNMDFYLDIGNVFEKLPDIENSLQVDTRTTLSFIEGYICFKDEKLITCFFITREILFFLENHCSSRSKSPR